MTRPEPRTDELLERRVARLLDTDTDPTAWSASVEEALRRSAKVQQRRRLRILRWPGSGGTRLSMAVRLAAGVTAVSVIAIVVVARAPWTTEVTAPGVDATPPPAAAVEPFVETRVRVPPFEPLAAKQYAGSLWVTTLGSQIHRLDPVTGKTTGGAELPGNACGPIAVAEGYLWMPSCTSGPGQGSRPTFLTQLDPATGRVVRNVRLASGAGLGAGSIDGAVWVIADVASGQLAAIDPVGGTVSLARPLGREVTHLAAVGHSLWLSVPGESAVIQVDPMSGTESGRVTVVGEPTSLLPAHDGVWVAVRGAKSVERIDTARLRIDITVPVGENPVQLEEASSSVWVLTRVDVFRLDAATGEIMERIAVGQHAVAFAPQFSGPTFAMAAGDDLWFVPPRGEMLRLRVD